MPIINISNATIQNISSDRGNTFVTITYRSGGSNRGNLETVRLVVGPRTLVLNANDIPVPATALRTGMTINATFSSVMTRSIPPQSNAYVIRITGRPQQDSITTGRILNIDRNNRNFTLIQGQNVSSIIRFNVSENTVFLNRAGRPVNFSALSPGMPVRVRHASFMTASIPPQTTAFEVRII